MHGPATAEHFDESVDILGQQPNLNMYTQLCLCFSVPNAFSHPAIINVLTVGLQRLSASFPWVAGKVVNEGSGEGNSGIFKIKPFEKIPRLVVKDLRDDPLVPTMDDLRRANFPFSMLDESVIAPRKTRPRPEESTSDSPVFVLQANFITGGLLLTFLAQHNVMDMTGQGQIMHLLSKACRLEEFTSEELASGNLSRGGLIPLLEDSYEPGSELYHQIVKPIPSSSIANGPPASPPRPKCTWAYFTFDAISLAALKSLATKTITLPMGFISTDDALSAFIWQSIIRARLPRLTPVNESTFIRAVDIRRYFNIPATYPGLMQSMTYHTFTLQKLAEEPLGAVASQLRSAVDPKTSNLAYHSRALATFLNRSPDKSAITFTATLDLSTDLLLSSWAKETCYDLDFNLGLDKPEAVRRPRFDSAGSLIYLMPRSLDGEIAAGICLRDEDMERLRADEQFVKYGRYVG